MNNSRITKIITASWVSVAGNAALSVLKISIGFIAGSMAVVGDGIDSASDIVASLITLITARFLAKPPTKKFPYGYEKADALASKVLAFIIFFAGAQLAISTISELLQGTEKEIPSKIAVYVTIISVFGKILLALYQFRIGKATKSEMLIANARNMQNDVLISAAVLTGLIFTFVLKLPIIDSLMAIAVSIWIMITAVRIFMKTTAELLDGVQDESVYNDLFKALSKVPGVYNPHRARIRKIGNQHVVAVDIEVNPEMTVKASHELSRKVEQKIKEELENVYDVLIHIEPRGNVESDEKFGISNKNLH